MKRLLLLLAMAALFAWTGISHGGPKTPFKPQLPSVPQLASQTYMLEFKGGQPATAIAIGNGHSFLGLYIYDSHGNCVAWDDDGQAATWDDLAVEWYPPSDQRYTIELRNAGVRINECKLIVR